MAKNKDRQAAKKRAPDLVHLLFRGMGEFLAAVEGIEQALTEAPQSEAEMARVLDYILALVTAQEMMEPWLGVLKRGAEAAQALHGHPPLHLVKKRRTAEKHRR